MNAKQKQIAGAVLGAVIVAGAGFYGGYAYAKPSFSRGQFGQMQFTRTGAGAQGGANAQFMRGGVSGEIVSKDSASITVKMQNGSTKLVLVGTSTPVMKTASGSFSDLSVGTNVVVAGEQNSDGSVTAESVTLRPAMRTQ